MIWNLDKSGAIYLQNELYFQRFIADAFTVPYAEAIGFVSSLRWNKDDRWFGFASLSYIGERESERGANLSSVLLLEAKVEYFITNTFGLHVSGNNLLNQNYYWVSHYQERPMEILGGLSLTW
jgi:hypothetical protein